MDVGEKITYLFEVTNTGSLRVRDIHVVDPMIQGGVTCPQTVLEPGKMMTCRAVHVVRAQDIVDGRVTNTAQAVGESVVSPVTSGEDTAVLTAVPDGPDGPGGPTTDAGLPDTGGPARWLLLLGILAMLGGAGLVLSARRRA